MGDSLSSLDFSVGQVFAKLDELGLSNNTLVFFSADNGPSLYRLERGGDAGPLRCGKGEREQKPWHACAPAPARFPAHPRSTSCLRLHTGTTWEGGQRVPGIAWWPGHIPSGTVSRDIASTMDIFPTVLSVLGLDLPKDRYYDGIDLSPVLFEGKQGTRDFYFYWPKNVDKVGRALGPRPRAAPSVGGGG